MNRWMLSASALLLAAGATAQAQDGWQEKLRINGYSNFEWEYSPQKAGRGDTNASFDAQEFDLVLNFQPAERLRFAGDLRWEHGVQSELQRGNAMLEYGFAEATVADWLKLRFGKQLVPFGIYNEIHTAKPVYFMYKEPFATNKQEKLGFGRRFFSRFQSGIEATGNMHVGGMESDYSVLVSNGETGSATLNPYELDDNKNKSTAARIRLRPVESLELGASYYHDDYTEYGATGKDTGLRTRQDAVGAHLKWRPGSFWTELEWVDGTWAPATTAKQTGRGAFAVVSYELRDRWRPYVQFQHFDPNLKLPNDRVMLYGPGVAVSWQTMLFKFQVDRYDSQPLNPRHKGINYTELTSAVALAF